MPKKLKPPGHKSTPSPSTHSLNQYSYQVVKEIVVRCWQGQPIQIVHPPHLTCLQNIEPTTLKVGRPKIENTIRYVLNRALFDYLYIPRDTPPQPLTRYGIATLALKRCVQERNRIQAFTKTSATRKEKLVEQFSINRKTLDNFLKRFFEEPGKLISPDELRNFFPSLFYQ